MKSKIVFMLLMTFATLSLQGQTCDCGKDFDFIATSYKEDYSGMQDFSKKFPDYIQVIEKLSKKAHKIKTVEKCDKIIGELIEYINNGHVVYGQTEENPLYGKDKSKKESISLNPTLQIIDNKTISIAIKTSDIAYKKTLDSLLVVNKSKLETTEVLLLDLRGNEGGSDAMFDNVIPYLYTNPILIHTTALWTSKNNIKLFENYFNDPDMPQESKNDLQKIISKAKQKPNDFVLLSDQNVDTLTLNSVLPFPKKVNIIIDKKCKSATEQFLLLAKQSKKTTIYGYENSGGALDYSNLNFIVTPSGYWYASVPTTRTTRLPENPVDPNGIPPDVLVDKKVNDIMEWVSNK